MLIVIWQTSNSIIFYSEVGLNYMYDYQFYNQVLLHDNDFNGI